MPRNRADAFNWGEQLWKMRNDNIRCDVVLQGCETNAKNISAHRLVLAARSTYFEAMFTSDMQESRQDKIQLKNIPSDALYALVKYAYTSTVDINEANVAALLEGALFMDFQLVAEMCWSFLEARINPESCLMEYYLANLYQRTALAEKTKKLVLRHFAAISQGTDFLQLKRDMVMMLLKSDDLNVEHEDSVLDAVLYWVRNDLVHRAPILQDLLSAVRLAHVTSEHLQRSLTGIIAQVDQQDSGLCDQIQHAAQMARSGPNRPRDSCGKILTHEKFSRVFMGFSGFVHCIDPQSGACSILSPVPDGLTVTGVADLDGSVFVLGALNSQPVSYRFYPETGVWKPLTSPKSAHFYGGVVGLGGQVYALGGKKRSDSGEYYADSDVRAVERYDPAKDLWQQVADLPHVLSHFGCGAYRSSIILFGGYQQPNWSRKAVLRYDIHTDVWTELTEMPYSRADCSVCVDGGDGRIIYVLGGGMPCGTLSRRRGKDVARRCVPGVEDDCMNVHAYEPLAEEWLRKDDLITTGRGLAVGAFRGQLYVIGGDSVYAESAAYQRTPKIGIQIYDEVMGTWSIQPARLPELTNSTCTLVKIGKEVIRKFQFTDTKEEESEEGDGEEDSESSEADTCGEDSEEDSEGNESEENDDMAGRNIGQKRRRLV